MIDVKGLADEAMKGSAKGKGESGEKTDPLELALDELFSATGKDRVAAFKAAVEMCRGYDDEE
jgi:hypothetical protein